MCSYTREAAGEESGQDTVRNPASVCPHLDPVQRPGCDEGDPRARAERQELVSQSTNIQYFLKTTDCNLTSPTGHYNFLKHLV